MSVQMIAANKAIVENRAVEVATSSNEDWTKWGKVCTAILSMGLPLMSSIAGIVVGVQEGVRSIFLLGCGVLLFYTILLVRQLSAKVELRSDGIYQKTAFSSLFVEYSDILGVDAENWSGDYYMHGSWPLDICVPVLILQSGKRKYLRRAFGPRSRVYELLNEVSKKAGLTELELPPGRTTQRKVKLSRLSVPRNRGNVSGSVAYQAKRAKRRK